MDDSRKQELWDEIWTLLEEGKSDEAAGAALRGLGEDEESPELHYLLGLALLDLDEMHAALAELEQSVELAGDWAESRCALAWAHFRIFRPEDAKEQVERALELDAELAEGHQLRGLLAERDGDEETALIAFAEARRLDPERFPEPYHLGEDEFLAVAQRVVAELDDPVRDVLEEAGFFVLPFPTEELLAGSDPPMDPQILGLFLGRSLLEQSVQDTGVLPNTLYLFQNNLERLVSSREELEEEIRITVLHEIGHHLGWDEDDLEERGLA